MKNVTELITEYKKNKNRDLLNKICAELKSTVQMKAKYIFYKQWYPMNLYHKCKYCKKCNKLKSIPRSEHSLTCKECKSCKCIKGFFNLRKENLCEYQDVENDIWLEVLRIIDNFDTVKDFNTYLISCLWTFKPAFITKDFVKSISHKSLTHVDDEGNETQIDIADEIKENKVSLEEILKHCKTDVERKVVDLFLKDRTMTQEIAGDKLKISHQAISLIFKGLKNRLKKYLQNQ